MIASATTGALFLYGLQAVLTSPDGGKATVDPARYKATVVVFSSTVCPVAGDYYPRLIELWRTYGSGRGDVGFYLVFPNKTESLDAVRAHAAEMRFPFPVYRDDANRLADALGAQVTPTAVVTGRNGAVAFRGAIDDAANPARVKRRYLADAVKAVLAGRPAPAVPASAREPYG